MKKSEVTSLVREIVDYTNGCVGRMIAESISAESNINLSREQAEQLLPLLEATVKNAAFTILSRQ